MTRLWSEGELIRIETDSQGRPVRFFWHERLHRLRHIEQRWQVDTDWWDAEGRVYRDYYAVTTLDGLLCVFYLDHVTEAWYLGRIYD